MIKRNILAISGSTRNNSINEMIINWIAQQYKSQLNIDIYNKIASLPHFRSDMTEAKAPEIVKDFYQLIAGADGILICAPEYIFSLPGSLKNALEWTVSTTVFTSKPVALIIASTLGTKAFEELQLIMKTLGAETESKSALLISGVKSKFNEQGHLLEEPLIENFDELVNGLIMLIDRKLNT